MGQKKAFYSHRIQESSCARKETADIDILVTSRNGDRKIMQSITIMSRPLSRIGKWNQLSQFFQDWDQQAISCPSPHCLVDQIQVQEPILVVATDQMPDHIKRRK